MEGEPYPLVTHSKICMGKNLTLTSLWGGANNRPTRPKQKHRREQRDKKEWPDSTKDAEQIRANNKTHLLN